VRLDGPVWPRKGPRRSADHLRELSARPLTLLSTDEAGRPPRALYAPKTIEAQMPWFRNAVHASRWLIHQMQNPLRASATPVNIASSSHWNIQYRLEGW
jgi:hypothetical protein